MRVLARKTPAREENPQYSLATVFEAIVNAVVHRDYSLFARRIRISMFQDRVEIDSPGLLPNGMTIDEMDSSQAARNNALTDVSGRIPVGNIPGSEHRVHMMEKRGDGVSIIFNKTQELVGVRPSYRIVDGTNLVLTIPAEKFEITPSDAIITVHAAGEPIVGADVLVLFPNKTWQRATTDERGEVDFNLYTTHLPMKVYAAMPGYAAGFAQEWIPYQGGLILELNPLKAGGSVIFPKSAGNIPGLHGHLNPIRDNTDRAYLYGDNVAIDEGKQQPVTILLNRPMRLTDSHGVEMAATFIDITGQSALLEYRLFEQNNE